MRTSSKITVLAVIVLCLLGCDGHDGHDREAEGGHEAEHEAVHTAPGHSDPVPAGDEHEGHGSGLELALNDGEKWPVDDSTRESATRLASLVNDADAIQTADDARALGKALDQELDTLVKGCKMTGPAHDQLHLFLLALFPQVEALAEKTEITDLQSARREIDSLLEAYSNHFES